MDYPSLFEILPKSPSTWNTHDVLLWLNFISLSKLAPLFQQKKIDGSCLSMLDEGDLCGELGITSKITLKKVIKWIEVGLKKYQQYIDEQYSRNLKQRNVSSKTSIEVERNEELIVTYYEGNQSKFYKITENGTLIGSNLQCEVLILEDTVSNRHAEITKKNHQFYIKDLGSKYGTFVKVSKKQPLKKGMILEMGSFEFEIIQVNTVRKTLQMNVEHQMLGKTLLTYDFSKKTTYCFGRKESNDFNYEDQHMSGIHAKICFLNGDFYVQDMQSTNGTWMRLSKSYDQSSCWLLQHETIFKVGSVSTFICKYQSEEKVRKMSSVEVDCGRCESKKDCFFLPCRHNIMCFECASQLEQCLVCGCIIQEKIKIFI